MAKDGWNGFKGAAKRIEDLDLPRIGHEIGVGEDELHAFMDVESRGVGFDKQGRPQALYEPHVAWRNSSGETRRKLAAAGLAYPKWGAKPYPKDSYPRIKKAMAIDETVALKATSWGLTQILGENAEAAGFDSPQEMVRAFMADEEHHLSATVELMVNMGIDDDLRALAKLKRATKASDCVAIVRAWNGPGYKKNDYHTKFAKAHNKWRKIPDTPWSPDADIPIVTTSDDWPIEAIQARLDELGYHEVGAIDGKWGGRTRTAVLAFRADNGLPLDPTIDKDFLAALMVAEPRPVAPERANATVEDLREKGSETIQSADKADLAGKVAIGTGVVAGATKVLDAVEEYSSLADRALTAIEPFRAFLVDNALLLLIGVGGVVVWQAYRIRKIRVEEHRTGKNVGL